MRRHSLITVLFAVLNFGMPVLLFASPQGSSVEEQQSSSFNITYFTGESSNGVKMLSADGELVSAVWTRFTQGMYEIRATSSTDGGTTFSAPKTLFSRTAGIWLFQIEVFGSTVVVLWLEVQPQGNDLFVTRSLDNGVTYSSPVNVSRSPQTASGDNVSMIVKGSNITIIWGDEGTGIYTATSFDGGMTFGDSLLISNRPGSETNSPSMALGPSGHIYAAWQWEDGGDKGIDFTRSTDYGMTFEPPTNVLPGHCCMRTLLANGGVIYLQSAWQPLISSTDGGLTWQSLFPGISSLSTTSHSNSTLYVDGWIWHEDTSSYSVHIASSGDNGTTFLSHELGTLAGQCGWDKGTSAFGQMAATWWTDTDPETDGCSASDIRELVIRTTIDGGQSFGQLTRFPLSHPSGSSVFVSQSRIEVLRLVFNTAPEFNAALYFSVSTNNGVTYSDVQVASGLTQLQATVFDVSQNGDIIHVIADSSAGLFIATEIISKEEEIPIFKDGFEG